MLPWGHVGFAYLLFAALCRAAGRSPPSVAAVALVVLGAVTPDLVDKPLGWWLEVIPHGRALAHTPQFGAVAVTLAAAVAVWRGRPDAGVAFGVGYASHLVGDFVVEPLAPPGVDIVVFACALALWVADGTPGRDALVRCFRRRVRDEG